MDVLPLSGESTENYSLKQQEATLPPKDMPTTVNMKNITHIDDTLGKAGNALKYLHAAKALYYMTKGDTEQAWHHGKAAGTMVGVEQVMKRGLGSDLVQENLGKAVAHLSSKSLQNLGPEALKTMGARAIPGVNLAVSYGFAEMNAQSKETHAEAWSERAAGVGEAAGSFIGSVPGVIFTPVSGGSSLALGVIGGEVGREGMNMVSYAVTLGNYSGDPGLIRQLAQEGFNFADAVNLMNMMPHVHRASLEDHNEVKYTPVALSQNEKGLQTVALPVLDITTPPMDPAIEHRLDRATFEQLTNPESKLEKTYRLMGQVKYGNATSFFSKDDVEGKLTAYFEEVDRQQDSLCHYRDAARSFNAQREQLMDMIQKSGMALGDKKLEEMVPLLDAGDKISEPKAFEGYAKLSSYAAETFKKLELTLEQVESMTLRQKVELIKTQIAEEGVSMPSADRPGMFFQKQGSEKYQQHHAINKEMGKFLSETYIPYQEKLQSYAEKISHNNEKIEAFKTTYEVATLTQAVRGMEQCLKLETGQLPQTTNLSEQKAILQKRLEELGKMTEERIKEIERTQQSEEIAHAAVNLKNLGVEVSRNTLKTNTHITARTSSQASPHL